MSDLITFLLGMSATASAIAVIQNSICIARLKLIAERLDDLETAVADIAAEKTKTECYEDPRFATL